MSKKMLIDATHPEETRVALVNGNKLEEYDHETAVRRQLKGNIYLVKVTRVEPSLQAAFVDFGGNRHGFLPFPEIHPDYYRIPIADREALLAEERALAAAEAAKEDALDEAELAADSRGDNGEEEGEDPADDLLVPAPETDETGEGDDVAYVPRHTGSLAADIAVEAVHDKDEDLNDDEEEEEEEVEEEEEEEEEEGEGRAEEDPAAPEEAAANALEPDSPTVPAEGKRRANQGRHRRQGRPRNVDAIDGEALFRPSIKRRYKIQEVIKRNQIMLIQISKEERGNKGAAVTSYISLPGRYCVLMPNSPRGGGVSRKVSNAKDRQRLKHVLKELNVPEGMSVILRTAGVARDTAEIKRDLDYLLRLWDEIRELTLKSTAPALIYEEGNLVKRAIRDLYRRDIDEVLVAGDAAYESAREFMRALMPSHENKVVRFEDGGAPLFTRYQVESQIDAIHSPTVHLKSGGYIVINPTEALVSIDINSGRATKGRHIEETALKTNIEAADEIARQLRLRDLGGLIVIDFIDMEDRRGNRAVEKRMREVMAGDRARIQIGRISPFGLMELSRQRMHPSLVETNFETCPHCGGLGLTRTIETSTVMLLRAIEEEALKGKAAELKVSVPEEVGFYVFNHKRDMLSSIEKRYGVCVSLQPDDTLIKPNYTIEALHGANAPANARVNPAPVQSVEMADFDGDVAADEAPIITDADAPEEVSERGDRGDQNGRRSRGRRGGRRRGGRNQVNEHGNERGGNRRPQGGRPTQGRPVATEIVGPDSIPGTGEQPYIAPVPPKAAPAFQVETAVTHRPAEPVRAAVNEASSSSASAAGTQEDDALPANPRRGWWKRLTE